MKGMKKRVRPIGVTILALVVLYVAVTNLLRLVQSIAQWIYLTGLLSFSPAYLTFSGLVWGIVFLWLAWGLWRGSSYAPRLAIWVFIFYSIFYWVDRLLLPGPTTRNTNWVFSLIVHIAVLLCVVWLLSTRKSRRFFGVTYEE